MPFHRAAYGRRGLALMLVVITAAVGLVSLGGCSAPANSATPQAVTAEELDAQGGGRVPDSPEGLEKIDHFIFIIQENRSFDSYFGTYPGAEGIPAGVSVPGPLGVRVASYHNAALENRGGPHGWAAAMADIHGGLMDGFVREAWPSSSPNPLSTAGTPNDVMGYHDYREIPNYWDYANLYVLQDHMFAPVRSYTLPSHVYMLAGQSGGYVAPSPVPGSFTFPEITQLLHDAGVDWKYYVRQGSPSETRRRAILAQDSAATQAARVYSYMNPLLGFPAVRNDPTQSGRVAPTDQFYLDAAAGKLPQVCWLVPSDAVSEHPPANVADGMAYVTGIVNAVMQSPDWQHAAIFITWDEWGGFYDHVVPPKVDAYGFGLRVPGLIISPYAKHGFVDHKAASTGSWLRIVEERFRLPSLTARDSHAYDMIDAFDFGQPPRGPVLLQATAQGSLYPPALSP